MTLTSKQRAALRGSAAKLDTTLQIGKDGVTDAVIKQISDIVTAHELMKLKVLETAMLTAREACDAVCEALDAAPVQVIGSRFVIYKENSDKRQYAAVL